MQPRNGHAATAERDPGRAGLQDVGRQESRAQTGRPQRHTCARGTLAGSGRDKGRESCGATRAHGEGRKRGGRQAAGGRGAPTEGTGRWRCLCHRALGRRSWAALERALRGPEGWGEVEVEVEAGLARGTLRVLVRGPPQPWRDSRGCRERGLRGPWLAGAVVHTVIRPSARPRQADFIFQPSLPH